MKHKTDYQKHCEKLNKTISFLIENDFHFTLESVHYLDDEYFNFSNVLKIWEKEIEKEIYLEVKKNKEVLYIYSDDYSARTGRPDEVIKDIENIKKFLKSKKGEVML